MHAPIAPAPTLTDLPPEISELVVRILRENDRAFCIVSDEFQEGGHPLPIYRVDENGRGVECGRADVLVVKDGVVIAVIGGRASTGAGDAYFYYEWKNATDERERGPYEVAKECAHIMRVRTNF